jgi:hypothetical protein
MPRLDRGIQEFNYRENKDFWIVRSSRTMTTKYKTPLSDAGPKRGEGKTGGLIQFDLKLKLKATSPFSV